MKSRLGQISRWLALLGAVVAIGAAVRWFSLSTYPHRRTILVDGQTRRYLLYAPSSRSPALKPLVLAFHGFDGTPENMAEESRLHELVGEGGFYLAYLGGDPSWQLFVPENAQVSRDVVFFDRLCDELIETLPIDPDRIYAVGMSRGGDFAVYLAEHRSTRVAAIVSQAACVPKAVEAQRPFPLMFIVGTADGGIPPDRLLSVSQAFRDRGHIVEVIRPENIGHAWHISSNKRLGEFLSRHSLKNGAGAVGSP